MASARALRAALWGAGPLMLLTVAIVAWAEPLRPAVAQVRARPAPAPNPDLRMAQATAETWLRAHGIRWRSNGNCSDRSRPDCTSFSYTYADEHETHWDIVFTAAWHPSDHDLAG
jgi:hypothetical protein